MYKNNRIFAIICARGNSKGVPGKNIRPLLGKPLIAHTIEQAKTISFIDKLIVSTEDPEIAVISKKYGAEVPFLRPPELATDTSPTESAIVYTLIETEKLCHEFYDLIVLLDPTNPIRKTEEIEKAIELLLASSETESVISAVESFENPYYDMFELDKDGYAELSKRSSEKLTRRQDAPKVYTANASIYVARREPFMQKKSFLLKKMKLFIMPEDSAFDIDHPIDFELVEFLLKRRKKIK